MYIFIHVSQSHGHFFLHTHKRPQIIGKRLKKREPIEIIFSSLSKLGTDSADLVGWGRAFQSLGALVLKQEHETVSRPPAVTKMKIGEGGVRTPSNWSYLSLTIFSWSFMFSCLICSSPESKKDFLKAVHSILREKQRRQLLKTECLPPSQQYVPFGGKRLSALKGVRPTMNRAGDRVWIYVLFQ